MDLKDHKNIQTEWTQDTQSLFSPSHLLPACNHRHRVTLLARFGTPRSHFSQGQKQPHLLSTICRRRDESCGGGVKQSDPTGVTQGLICVEECLFRTRAFAGQPGVCSRRYCYTAPTHGPDLHRLDRCSERPATGGRLVREMIGRMRVKPVEKWREKDVEEANLKK